MSGRSDPIHRVAEVAPVTAESLEQALNDQAAEGWSFQSIHFVTREGSHRPAMAYLFFARTRGDPPRADG